MSNIFSSAALTDDHISFHCTALHQSLQDGKFIKHLKDCAFPLPMSALGGGTQGFESFEGALLDVVS